MIVDVTPGEKLNKWRQLRGLVMGLVEGASIGVHLPTQDDARLAAAAVHNLEAKYQIPGAFATKIDRHACIVWITRHPPRQVTKTPRPEFVVPVPESAFARRYRETSFLQFVRERYGPDAEASIERVIEWQHYLRTGS